MEIISVIITILVIVGIILSSILKPSIKIGRVNLSIYWMIALLGAIIILSFGLLPFDIFVNGLFSDEGMNPIKILVLFLSMTCLSIFLDELGFFSALASYVLKKTGSSQIKVFISFYILVSLLTMFTSNDIVILTLTPFIISFCKRAKISPIPYLVSEFIAANTWSMIFIIGNPTNIYIASSYNIKFIDYFLVMAVPTILAGLAEFFLLFLIFNKKLKEPITRGDLSIPSLEMPQVIVGLTILIICTIFLVLSSYIQALEMWYVSLGSLVILVITILVYSLIKKRTPIELGKTFKRAPYELIPFLLSMFTLALTMKHYNITTYIHDFFGSNQTNITYGYSSLISSNLLNNIPMSVFYSNIIYGLEGNSLKLAVYSTIIGSNIGAFLTPLGALAGIMWMNILKSHQIKFSFMDFVKYGFLIGLVVASIAILTIILFI